MIVAKECIKCREVKPVDEFYRHKASRNGLLAQCKACVGASQADRRANPEVKSKLRDYRAKNAERISETTKEWRSRNRDKVRARDNEYKERNRGQLRLKQMEYISNNPHVQWEYRYRRRALEYGLAPCVETFTREELIAAYGDACVDCEAEWDTLEHVVPVSAGGEHSLANCRPLCFSCNRRRWRDYQRAAIAAYSEAKSQR